MKLIFTGHNDRYAIEQDLLAFFPNERPVYDPEADMTITAENQHSAAGYTPFEGFRTHGSIAQVWLRGQLAVEHGELCIGAVGEYIPRHPGAL